jgi:uncharacterized protein YraI
MGISFSATLLSTIALTLSLAAAPAYAACTKNVSTYGKLNIRSAPSNNAGVVGHIPGQSCGVRLLDCEDGWCRIEYKGVAGYSNMNYLTDRTAERKPETPAWQRATNNILDSIQGGAKPVQRHGQRDGSHRGPDWADRSDWQLVGTLAASRHPDRDVIQFKRRDHFEALRLHVNGGPVEFERIAVVFGNGNHQVLDFSGRLDSRDRPVNLDLKGNRRVIDRIEFDYRNASSHGRPSGVEVWARSSSDEGRGDPRASLGPNWERLSSQQVDRKRDRDVIEFSRRDGSFDALRLRVARNDVRVRRMQIQYGNGKTRDLDVDKRIGEGELSDVIELHGEHGRFIDRVVLFYDTVGRGPTAQIELWGHSRMASRASDSR